MKLQPTTLDKEYEEIKKSKLIEKDEAILLLQNWIKDQIEYSMRYKPKSDDRLVEDVFDLIVDHWISQPLLLAACREVNFDKQWISDRVPTLRHEVEEELREEAIDIIEDKTEYGLPQTRPIMPMGGFGEGPMPIMDDGRIMEYSLTTIDEEFGKSRRVGAKDKQKRKKKNFADKEIYSKWTAPEAARHGDVYGKSMEKSQVKSHIRNRKGKMERVKEYSRIGEASATYDPSKPEKEKNTASKMRKVDSPYEIWRSGDGPNAWEWRVLKKYQSPSKEKANPYARWMCAVKSPYIQGSYDYGDVYVKEIKSQASKVAELNADGKSMWHGEEVTKSRTPGARDKQKRKSNPKNWEYWEANDKKYQSMQKKRKLFSKEDSEGIKHWADDYRQAKKYGNEKLAGEIRQNIHNAAKKIIHKALEKNKE